MENIRKSSGCLALSFLLLCGACRQVENPGKVFPESPTVEDTRSHEVSRNPPEDIPVPRDMLYETANNVSFSYLQGGVRVGRFSYWGNLSTEDVVAFYRERMPQRPFGWNLVNEQVQSSRTRLSYRKEADRLDLDISPGRGGTVAVIYLNNQNSNP